MATGLSGSAFAAGLTLRDARTGKECGWEGKGVPDFWGLSVRWAPCYPRMKEEWNEGSLPLNLFLPTSAALPCFPCCLIEWYWTSNWQKAFHSRLSPIKPPSLLVMSLFVRSLPNLHCLSFVCCLTEKGKKHLAEEHTRSLLAHLFRVVGGVGKLCDGLWPSGNLFHFSKDWIVTGIRVGANKKSCHKEFLFQHKKL